MKKSEQLKQRVLELFASLVKESNSEQYYKPIKDINKPLLPKGYSDRRQQELGIMPKYDISN